MPVQITLSSHVRSYTGGQARVEAEGATLAQVLADLERRYPGIRFRLVDEQDRIRPHMNVFIAGSLVRDLDHPVAPGDTIHILAALSGGR